MENKKISMDDALLSEILKDCLEGELSTRWTEQQIHDILVEAVRLIRKDDYFWDAVKNAVKIAIDNTVNDDDDSEEDDSIGGYDWDVMFNQCYEENDEESEVDC